MKDLLFHTIENYKTYKGVQFKQLDISYQVFGKELHTAPVVVVNHAFTGNSDVASLEKGWWKQIIGEGKLIDLNEYTVIAFNILGNGYDGNLLENYKDFIAKDIAAIFNRSLHELGIDELYAVIGGSLGGGIAWEMAALEPDFIQYLIPVAADWKSTDWIIGHNSIQESILKNSKHPLQDARKMAMLFYRTPQSFTHKFLRTKKENTDQFNVESWLDYHGEKLEQRFELQAYKMMNYLLTTIDITRDGRSFAEVVQPINSIIIQIAVDSDLFFIKDESIANQQKLNQLNIKNEYHEIKSIHGHDAFLIEHDQIIEFLSPIFQVDTTERNQGLGSC